MQETQSAEANQMLMLILECLGATPRILSRIRVINQRQRAASAKLQPAWPARETEQHNVPNRLPQCMRIHPARCSCTDAARSSEGCRKPVCSTFFAGFS
jgi:hypothetical protein